jgi:hypothetical protein
MPLSAFLVRQKTFKSLEQKLLAQFARKGRWTDVRPVSLKSTNEHSEATNIVMVEGQPEDAGHSTLNTVSSIIFLKHKEHF